MIGAPYIYGALGLGLIAALTGSYLSGHSRGVDVERGRWELVQAKERAAAATVAADAEKRARDADNRAAEAARTVESEHDAAVKDMAATRAAFDERLRRAASSRQACTNSVPAAAPGAGQPAPVTPRSDGPGGDYDTGPGGRLRDVALALQADVKSCWGWVATVGR